MYQFRLQWTDGSPADPPTYRSSTLNWRQGDTIPFNAERTFAFSASGCDSTEETMRHSPGGFGRERAGKAQPAIRGKE